MDAQVKELSVNQTCKSRKRIYPSVSLIISNFNGKELLKDCLHSLFNQTYPGSYEIIVVDAGSTDGSPEMVEQEFTKVKLIRKNRVGIGKAINIGLRVAKGEILAFNINNDEVFSPDWLRILVDTLLDHPNAGVVGGVRVLFGTRNIIDEAGISFNFFGIPFAYTRVKLVNIEEHIRKVDYVGVLLFHRKLLDEIGYCDENYVLYGEDEDFCARVKKAGYDVLVVPRAISFHKRSAIIGRNSPLSVYYERRSHIRFIIKNFSLLRMFFALLWYVYLLTFVEAIMCTPFFKKFFNSKNSRLFFLSQRATKENFRAIIEALYWNLRHLKATILTRQYNMIKRYSKERLL